MGPVTRSALRYKLRNRPNCSYEICKSRFVSLKAGRQYK